MAEADHALGAGEEEGRGCAPGPAGGGWKRRPGSNPGPLWAAPGAGGGSCRGIGERAPCPGKNPPPEPGLCPQPGTRPTCTVLVLSKAPDQFLLLPKPPSPQVQGKRAGGPGWHLSRLVTPGQSCGPSPLREAALSAGGNKQINSQAGRQVRQGQPQREGRGSTGPERAGPQLGSHGTVPWAPKGADR